MQLIYDLSRFEFTSTDENMKWRKNMIARDNLVYRQKIEKNMCCFYF